MGRAEHVLTIFSYSGVPVCDLPSAQQILNVTMYYVKCMLVGGKSMSWSCKMLSGCYKIVSAATVTTAIMIPSVATPSNAHSQPSASTAL